MSTTLITEHPAWHRLEDGGALRVVESAEAFWSARWADGTLHIQPSCSRTVHTPAPQVARASAHDLPDHPQLQPLVGELAKLETVERLTNPSLWDALATAVLRQVVRAGQAKKVYRAFCTAHGRSIATTGGPLSVVPQPEAVLGLGDAAFSEVGAAFHRDALRYAAKAYLEHGPAWQLLDADSLMKELLGVRRIGPWTAAAAAADFTGDHAVYPHGDLAVRTWAARAAPTMPFPTSDGEFETLWRRCAPDRVALHTLTLFTLTWGNHVRSTPHEGAPHQP
ncbi:hypothetical protein ACFYVL_40445 [Streptomyces sp. NPDC004111]|uniref:hypothetical protein n=1 Tax=Streptomyces sp. NPDC004111 TaxID=3364690 RepID=UPI0036C20D27